jgi:hypothetical protein
VSRASRVSLDSMRPTDLRRWNMRSTSSSSSSRSRRDSGRRGRRSGAGHGRRVGLGGREFAPELAIRDAVEQSLSRKPAQVPEQRSRGLPAARVKQKHAAAVGEREVYGQGRNPSGPIHAPDFIPPDRASADQEVGLADFDRRQARHAKHRNAQKDQQRGSETDHGVSQCNPCRDSRCRQDTERTPIASNRRSVARDRASHSF